MAHEQVLSSLDLIRWYISDDDTENIAPVPVYDINSPKPGRLSLKFKRAEKLAEEKRKKTKRVTERPQPNSCTRVYGATVTGPCAVICPDVIEEITDEHEDIQQSREKTKGVLTERAQPNEPLPGAPLCDELSIAVEALLKLLKAETSSEDINAQTFEVPALAFVNHGASVCVPETELVEAVASICGSSQNSDGIAERPLPWLIGSRGELHSRGWGSRGELLRRSLPFGDGGWDWRSLPFGDGGWDWRSLPFGDGGWDWRSLPFGSSLWGSKPPTALERLGIKRGTAL
ncbi:uncharacterized protein LOC142948023 [Anarhichas minor]|uniref:uncharacterized protein LOC142948023 n=1 Tax=Anarhichas minor TaxID=65739 RepID=UPI003F73F6DD